MAYNETVGTFVPDNLIASTDVPLKAQGFTVKTGQGKLARGTVMCINVGSGGDKKCVALGTSKTGSETQTIVGILCDDIDATSGDIPTAVYVSGCFNRNALLTAQEHALNDDDEIALRNCGIYLETSIHNHEEG